jgi:hypothetical protein
LRESSIFLRQVVILYGFSSVESQINFKPDEGQEVLPGGEPLTGQPYF